MQYHHHQQHVRVVINPASTRGSDVLWERCQTRSYRVQETKRRAWVGRVLNAMSRHAATPDFYMVVAVLQETSGCRDLLTLWQRNQL